MNNDWTQSDTIIYCVIALGVILLIWWIIKSMQKTKTIIICDTNIWYRLGDGRISPEAIGDNEFAVTGINLEELCSSEVIYSDPNLFKGALKAIDKYAKHWILEDPIDNILKRIDSTHKPITTKFDNMKKTVELGLQTDLEELTKDVNKVEGLKKAIAEYNEPKELFIAELNSALPKLRREIKGKYNKKQFRKKDHIPEVLLMFKGILEDRAKRKLSNIDWESLEFILFAWDVYFKEKSLDQSKCKPNDYEDLTNTGYVKPDMLYWTKDDKEPYRSLRKNKYAKKYFYNE